MRVDLIVAAGILCLGPLCSNAAAGDGKIRISIRYHEDCNQVRPFPGPIVSYQNLAVTLHDQHFASEHREWQSGDQHGVVDSDGAFGAAVRSGAYDVDWRVSGQKSLFRVKTGPQHVETLAINVRGNRCTASFSYRLKPGFSEYLLLRPRVDRDIS